METPASVPPSTPLGRSNSLALAESQNIQQSDQQSGNTRIHRPAKSSVAMKNTSSVPPPIPTAGANSPAVAGVSPRAGKGSSKKGKGSTSRGRKSAPATPAVAKTSATPAAATATPAPAAAATPAATATSASASSSSSAAASAYATPAVVAVLATPAAPARLAVAGAGSGSSAEAGRGAVATDRMILATPKGPVPEEFEEPKEPDESQEPEEPKGSEEAATPVTPPAAGDPAGTGDDGEAESLALARQLLEEEAMASYAAAVEVFRTSVAAAAASGGGGDGGIEGVAAEDLAAMQALLEEDESSPDAFAMAEDESLDYEGMLELGTAIGDVRKDRWKMRCKAVIAGLPRMIYSASDHGGGDDTKCLVCLCEYEEGDELTRLPCSHKFHTACVDGWLQHNEECPTCRTSVSPQG